MPITLPLTTHPGVDVLVSELNFGAGSRWVKAGATLPEAPSVEG